jgi:predicted  nucleic acid-binding Zn-ribbon protein
MRDSNKLTYDELVQINDELRYIIADLKKEKAEFEKCTARVYAPDQSYKDFEKKVDQLTEENLSLVEKITILEEEKKTAINRLVDSMSQANKELQELKNKYYKLQEDDLYLKKRIKDQDAIIHLAAGYISSTPQFSKEHPMNVLSWLKGVILS